MFYVVTNGLLKISILMLYLEIFPEKKFRIRCWLVILFLAMSTTAFTLASIFQCHPITRAFIKDSGTPGYCFNYNALSWSHAAVNILQDFLIILLPISELRRLHLDWTKKLGVIFMFGLWSFVCITSIVRLYSLRTFGLTADPTWDNVNTTIWSSLEICTAMVCASLPAMRAAYSRILRKSRGLSTHNSNNNLTGGPSPFLRSKMSGRNSRKSWNKLTLEPQGNDKPSFDMENVDPIDSQSIEIKSEVKHSWEADPLEPDWPMRPDLLHNGVQTTISTGNPTQERPCLMTSIRRTASKARGSKNKSPTPSPLTSNKLRERESIDLPLAYRRPPTATTVSSTAAKELEFDRWQDSYRSLSELSDRERGLATRRMDLETSWETSWELETAHQQERAKVLERVRDIARERVRERRELRERDRRREEDGGET